MRRWETHMTWATGHSKPFTISWIWMSQRGHPARLIGNHFKSWWSPAMSCIELVSYRFRWAAHSSLGFSTDFHGRKPCQFQLGVHGIRSKHANAAMAAGAGHAELKIASSRNSRNSESESMAVSWTWRESMADSWANASSATKAYAAASSDATNAHASNAGHNATNASNPRDAARAFCIWRLRRLQRLRPAVRWSML